MFVHPELMKYRIEEQQKELLNYAMKERKISIVKRRAKKQPGTLDRVYVRFAELLINIGTRIKERHQAMVSPYTDACGALGKQNSL